MTAVTNTAPSLTVLIDNYDSFTYNVYQYLCQLSSTNSSSSSVRVYRNDEISLKELIAARPARLVVSPGPGSPSIPTDVGVSRAAIDHFAGKIPILGICLGHQCIFECFGGKVDAARGTTPDAAHEIVHGKTSPLRHSGVGVFRDVPQGCKVVRYHSLAGIPETLPSCLEVTARTDSGVVMGVRHRELSVEGVQFHPESILTEHGMRMLGNFMRRNQGTWKREEEERCS